jgi:C4-dicarboxylate transporter
MTLHVHNSDEIARCQATVLCSVGIISLNFSKNQPVQEEQMSEQPINPDITSDDKLWALLSYIFSPLIPLIMLLMEDKKKRPFIKFHAVQAIVLGVVEFILYAVLGWIFCWPVPGFGALWLYGLCRH